MSSVTHKFFFYMDCFSHFSDKIPHENQFKKSRVYFGSWLRKQSMDRNGEASSRPAVLQEWEALRISASLESEKEEQCHMEHDLHWPFVFHQQ